MATPRTIEPCVSVAEEQGREWHYSVLPQITEGVRAGDRACIEIGVELICDDRGLPFGAIYKSNMARALKSCDALDNDTRQRIRERIVSLYETGTVPREFREYSRLLRKIGVGECQARILAAKPENRFATRARQYFLEFCIA